MQRLPSVGMSVLVTVVWVVVVGQLPQNILYTYCQLGHSLVGNMLVDWSMFTSIYYSPVHMGYLIVENIAIFLCKKGSPVHQLVDWTYFFCIEKLMAGQSNPV